MTAAVDVLSPEPLVLERVPVRIDPDEVRRFQNYQPSLDLPLRDALAQFEKALRLGHELMTPRLVYRAAPVSGQSSHGLDVGGEQLRIPDIGRLWGPLAAVGAAICTAGEPIEMRVRELVEARERSLAILLDSVGSAAVESLAEYANDLLCQAALEHGLRVTNRISPGYAGWETAEQAALFRLCPGAPIGVTLTGAGVMTPAKSISLLVGIGPAARVDHYFTQCRRCWMRHCAHRRAPATGTVRRWSSS